MDESAALATSALGESYLYYRSGAHGELFHLAALAYYTALPSTTVKYIEKTRLVELYDTEKNFRDRENPKTTFRRRVDIVLEGDGVCNGWSSSRCDNIM